MRVSALNDEDLLNCLSNWLRLTIPKQPLPDRKKLLELARQLHGYPLAARLAAYYVARYSVDALISETRHFKNLRVDLAKQLIGRARQKLTDGEVNCMEVLAIADRGVTLEDLCIALAAEPSRIQSMIDSLSSTLLIYLGNGEIQIHPLVKDYFWQISYDSGNWKQYALRLAEQAERQIAGCAKDTEAFVEYVTKAYRLFTISGHLDRARRLAYDLVSELREAAIRLYHAGDINLSLQYADTWLSHESSDDDVRWYRARCLTRLKRHEDAEIEFERLSARGYRVYKVCHGLGLLRRDQQRLEEAASIFREGLHDRRNYLPLLRELADVLERLGDSKTALQVIKEAVDIAPRDLYVLPKYADLLEKNGATSEALEILAGAIATFPEEAVFYHRMSRLLGNQGKVEEALKNAESAVHLVKNPRNLPEVRLNLAVLELRVGNADKADRLLQELPPDLEWREAQVRDNIKAELLVRQNDLEGARKLLAGHDILADPYTVRLAVQIEIQDAINQAARTQRVYACERLKIGMQTLESGLSRYPTNTYISEMRLQIDQLADAFGCS
jgi:tetratricopeptide (TPR) repeat protein